VAAFAAYRPLLVEVMTGDAEFVGCRLAPVVYFAVLLVMTLPTLVFGYLLVFVVSEFNGIFAHFKLYDFWAGTFRLFRHDVRCK